MVNLELLLRCKIAIVANGKLRIFLRCKIVALLQNSKLRIISEM